MSAVLYIAGYGRSGSTVLSIVLGSHPQIASVGELGFALDDWLDPNRLCSCRRPYTECEFWRDFLPRILPGAAGRMRAVERLSSLPRLWLHAWGGARRAEYRSVQGSLLEFVREKTGKPIVLDSSKSARLTAARALALSRLAGQEVYVLHLVRDGRATLQSLVGTGSNWALEGRNRPPAAPAVRAVWSWVCTNLWTSTLKWTCAPDRYLRIRYEDYVADPIATLRRLEPFLGVSMDPVAARIEDRAEFSSEHMVGGNRLRFRERISLRTDAARSPPRLSERQRLLFSLVGGWLNRRYGYEN